MFGCVDTIEFAAIVKFAPAITFLENVISPSAVVPCFLVTPTNNPICSKSVPSAKSTLLPL